jgi:hypothetical protein
VETFLRASFKLWLREIWLSLYNYNSPGGNREILIWIEFCRRPKVEKVTSIFKFIIKITTLKTQVKLPGGDIYIYILYWAKAYWQIACRCRVDTGPLRVVSSLCALSCRVGCNLELPVRLEDFFGGIAACTCRYWVSNTISYFVHAVSLLQL